MHYVNDQMERVPDHGITITLPIPAADPDLFKNKATDDVLLLLSRHRFEAFTIGELADRTGHTKQTVSRAVDVLGTNELVDVTPEGNRKQVRINDKRLSVPDDPYLRIPQSEFREPVKAAVDDLRDRLEHCLGIVLYGSVARGEADRRSDVDLWVLVGEDRAANQRAANRVRADLEERTFDGDRYAFDVDVEAMASVPRYTEDIREIVLSGIPLYETAEFETVTKLLEAETTDE